MLLALGSGLAGAISVIRNVGSALVGVAIAIALIPPAATSGLGIAWGLPGVALASALLVVINMLAVNVSTLVLFWLSGFRPPEFSAINHARYAVISRSALLLIAITILSVVLILVSFSSYQTYVIEQKVNEEVNYMFEEPMYSGIGLTPVEVSIGYDSGNILLEEPVRVDIVVAHPAAQEVPEDIAIQIDRRLTEAINRNFEVRVGFVETQQTA